MQYVNHTRSDKVHMLSLEEQHELTWKILDERITFFNSREDLTTLTDNYKLFFEGAKGVFIMNTYPPYGKIEDVTLLELRNTNLSVSYDVKERELDIFNHRNGDYMLFNEGDIKELNILYKDLMDILSRRAL